MEVPVTDLSVGKWVVVNYDGEKYPGEVTSCSEEIEVSVMHNGNLTSNCSCTKKAVMRTTVYTCMSN